MSEIITVGIDLAKNVFQLHGADASGRAVLRRKLRRTQVLEVLAALPSCTHEHKHEHEHATVQCPPCNALA